MKPGVKAGIARRQKRLHRKLNQNEIGAIVFFAWIGAHRLAADLNLPVEVVKKWTEVK